MSYSKEDKIQWEELSPSLQARFGGLAELVINAADGQVVKVNSHDRVLFADDDFRNCRVVSTAAELATEKTITTVDMSDIFNNWYRYAHYCTDAMKLLDNTNWDYSIPDGQNISSNSQYTDFIQGGAWTYDASTNQIHNNVDGAPAAGFISPTNDYNNYYLKIKADVGWDDDNIFIVVGYMKDTNGVEHTLSVVRGAGMYNTSGVDTRFTWGLIYDMGNSTQHFLIDYTQKAGYWSTYSSQHNTSYLSVSKKSGILTCNTTKFTVDGSDTNEVADWKFTYSLPNDKPASMAQEEYNNLKTMLGASNVGVGCRSTTGWFTIVEQEGIFDSNDIYSLYDKKVYSYDISKSTWVVKGYIYDLLPNRIFLYSKRFSKLYFYKNAYSYTLLSQSKSEFTIGMIMLWYSSTPPSGWAICNGQVVNGIQTPDLRDRFIVGAGSGYGYGTAGGVSTNTIKAQSLVSKHFHYIGRETWNNNGGFLIHHDPNWTTKDVELPDDARMHNWNGSGGDTNYREWDGFNIVTTYSKASSDSGNIDLENRPPFYGLYYIVKVS